MKKVYYFFSFISLLLLFQSCEKSLDLAPMNAYSEVTFFKNAEQFKLFANRFYEYLPAVGLASTGNNTSYTVFDYDRDIYSDLVLDRTTNTISDGSYYPTETSNLWNNSYKNIRNTTYLIQKADKANNPDLKENVDIYVGEAYFFRALTYFNLLRDFGGVPIIDKVLDLNDDDLLYGPRNTRQEVTDYILDDLNQAINLLPLESGIATADKGRVSKGAALALKARVALFEGTWRKYRNLDGYATLLDQAIDASDQVIKSAQYQLFDRRDVLGDESYRYFFILDKVKSNSANLTKADQKEYILVNRFDASLRAQPVQSIQWLPSPTKKLADMFLCTDGLPIDKSPLFKGRLTVSSEYENRDLRMKSVLLVPGTRIWTSQPAEQGRNWSTPDIGGYIVTVNFSGYTRTGYMECKFAPQFTPPSTDSPVIRYAEVLLIYAEALYEKNGTITDAQLDATINLLRTRAGVTKLSNAFVTSNGLNMRTEIRRERTIEMFMEGQRFDDLRRWKTAETEMPQALKGVQWTGTQYSTDAYWKGVSFPLDTDGCIIVQAASNRKFEQKHYLFPLPTRQILLNDKLEQNPGW